MTKPDCLAIECIYDDALKKGICVGVPQQLKNSQSKNVIRMCCVKRKPVPNTACAVDWQVQFTPREAVGAGVGLIRSSIVGESLLKRTEAVEEETALKHVKDVKK